MLPSLMGNNCLSSSIKLGLILFVKDLGPVVKNFVSLMLSLSPQFVNYISTSKANTLLFFVEKNAHIFSTKNNSVFIIFMFKILTSP